MTVALALEYIPRRMCELGYGDSYHIRFRHFLLMPDEQRAVSAYNQLFVLIEPPGDVRIESDTGLLDLNDDLTNEFQYEHTGELYLTNLSPVSVHVRFIQVIPKN